MLKPITIHKQSPFLGEECALCKHPFAPGDEIVLCPEDATRHHVRCWHSNGNKCTAYGCTGNGPIEGYEPEQERRGVRTAAEPDRRSKVRALPSSSLGCAQGCLVLSIAIAILLVAVSCFGLWAIADYIMLDVLGWQYRAPLSGIILPLQFLLSL